MTAFNNLAYSATSLAASLTDRFTSLSCGEGKRLATSRRAQAGAVSGRAVESALSPATSEKPSKAWFWAFVIACSVIMLFFVFAFVNNENEKRAYELFDMGFFVGATCQKLAQDVFVNTSNIADAVESVQQCRERSGLRRNERG